MCPRRLVARFPRPLRLLLALLLLLALASCGEVPTAPAPVQDTPAPPTVDSYPMSLTPQATWTPDPYPHIVPTGVPWTPSPPPTLPVVPVLGAEQAPLEQQETYVSTTLVVALVGDGPGEIGYWERPEAGHTMADRFAVDAQGNIYILDKVNRRVARFNTAGGSWATFPIPRIGVSMI